MQIGLIGATNVGKSTLFNRLIGQYRAIVTDIAGTTVDNLIHETENDYGKFTFIDSPGLVEFEEERVFIEKIVNTADLLLFVVDDTVGLTTKEERIFKYLMEQNKKSRTFLIVNKLDKGRKTTEYEAAIGEYYSLGFPITIGISAKNELNVETIRDEINNYIKEKDLERDIKSDDSAEGGDQKIHLAIVGKPNAGKSTLLNQIAGEGLSKVEDKAGTTRDYIFTDIQKGKQIYKIYDTAGIKKKGKMHEIEKIAYDKTLNMLKYIKPMVIFMIDANEGISHRDMSLLEEIHEIGLPTIVMLNKTDLLDATQRKSLITKAQQILDFAKYIPILPLIAKEGQGITEMMKMLHSMRNEFNKRIETAGINEIMAEEWITRPPRFPKNKVCKILYTTQIETRPPTFLCFINHKARANFAFKKRIENSIRKHHGFIGTPIKIYFRDRSEKDKSKKNYYDKQFNDDQEEEQDD